MLFRIDNTVNGALYIDMNIGFRHKCIVAVTILIITSCFCICIELMHTEKLSLFSEIRQSNPASAGFSLFDKPDGSISNTSDDCIACQWKKSSTSRLVGFILITLGIFIHFIFQSSQILCAVGASTQTLTRETLDNNYTIFHVS